MEERIAKILKALQSIKPEEGFIQRSRQIIMASEQKQPVWHMAAALALASLLLFIALGGFAYLNGGSAPLLADVEKNAPAESAPDFQIQLGEAKYNLGNDVEVGQVDEILKNLSL